MTARGGHRVVGRRHLERPAGRQLLVGIGHHETAGVELAGRLLDEFATGGVGAVAGDVEAVDVGRRLAVDHQFRQRLADAAALQKPRHDAAGEPVAAFSRDRADERIAVGREGEGAVDPFADANRLEDRIAAVDELELAGDPVDILLQKLDAIIPGRAVDRPVLGLRLVDADQHALLVLAHVGEPLEVHDHRQFGFQRGDLGDRLGQEVMMLERRQREVEPDHPADLLRPQASGIDHMLGVDGPGLGDDVPGRVRTLLQLNHPVVLDHRRAALLRRAGVSPDRSCGVDVALAVGPHASEHAVDVDDRAAGLDLLGRHQPDVVDADRLEAAIRRLKPLPALRRRRDMDAAGHVHADRLAGFRFDLLQKVDRVGLQDRHVGVGVERVEAAGGVPRRTRGQNRAFDQRDVAPAELRKMVKNRGAHHAPANNDHPILRFHARPP